MLFLLTRKLKFAGVFVSFSVTMFTQSFVKSIVWLKW